MKMQTKTVATYNVHEWVGRDRMKYPFRTRDGILYLS